MRLSNRLLALLVWGQSEMALSLDGYRLVGVLTGTTDRPGIALIEHDGTHHWVAEHRSLDGWTVDRIEYRRVVLRRDGRRSTIECNLATGAPRDDVDLLVGPELADTLMGASSYPVFGPQGLRGWGVRWIEPDSVYARLGFQDHDVVIEIDDRPLDDVEVTSQLFRRLTEAHAVSFRVERDGRSSAFRIAMP